MPSQQNSNGKQLIPFGKYRGQPLEVLERDPEYLNWLTNQDWFRTGHANLYQIVINNFAEPCDTPEHNQMQARFLDDVFRAAFVAIAGSKRGMKVEASKNEQPTFESGGADVSLRVVWSDDDFGGRSTLLMRIEIKPSVGDDFPSVMRQMKRSQSSVLFIRDYNGTGIDEEKFVEMFSSQKISVVFEREIDGSRPNCPVSVP